MKHNNLFNAACIMGLVVALSTVLVFLPETANAQTNLALNTSRTGFPHPLESDRGWGGGSDQWGIIDGLQNCPGDWRCGLAFCGGSGNYCGEPAGIYQSTINFGEPVSFNQVVVWWQTPGHTPQDDPDLSYWDDSSSQWISLNFTRHFDMALARDEYTFPTVTGSKVRLAFDNRELAMHGMQMSHGWIYEFEVFEDNQSANQTAFIATPDNSEVYPGDSVAVDVIIQGANDCYATQAVCSVDPAMLEIQQGDFGDFFDAVNRLVLLNTVDAAAGTWLGVISQQNPAGPLSGDGTFVKINFKAVSPGTTAITCEPIISDRDGFVQTVSFSGAEITVIPFESLDGTVTYQGRLEQAGIDVTVTGPVTLSAVTDSEGAFTFDQLKAGDYEVKVDADGYVPRCTTITVVKGEALTLPATTLLGGDLNGDDEIGIDDATLLTSNFGQTNAAADINGDGIVNVQDLAILGGNYGITGCQSWE